MKYIDTDELPLLPSWAKQILSSEPQSESILYDKELFIDALYDTAMLPHELKGAVVIEYLHKQGIRPLTTHVLDYLLSHPEEIPESWKGKFVMFLGTIFESQHVDDQWVRFVWWSGSGTSWKEEEGAVSSLGYHPGQVMNTFYAVSVQR